jgi:hypothetical protein
LSPTFCRVTRKSVARCGQNRSTPGCDTFSARDGYQFDKELIKVRAE